MFSKVENLKKNEILESAFYVLEIMNFEKMLGFRHFEILECGNLGIFKSWNFEILELRNFAILKLRNFESLKMWNFVLPDTYNR